MTKAEAKSVRQRVTGRLRKGRGRMANKGTALAPQGADADVAEADAAEDIAVLDGGDKDSVPIKMGRRGGVGLMAPLKAQEAIRRKRRARQTVAAQRLLRTASNALEANTRRDKDDMTSFLSKKRQMFLVQMALDVKRREMMKLKARATEREANIRRAELVLEEDHIRFETFLKENNESTSAALKRCETISHLKRERMTDIKKMVQTVQLIDTELTKQRASIVDCIEYQIFLSMLTPNGFFAQSGTTKPARLRHGLALRKELRVIQDGIEVDDAGQGGIKMVDRAIEVLRRLVRERVISPARGAAVLERDARGEDPYIETMLTSPRKGAGLLQQQLLSEGGGGSTATRDQVNAATAAAAEIANSDAMPLVVPGFFPLGQPQKLLEIYANLEERNLFLVQNRQQMELEIDLLLKRSAALGAANKAKMDHISGEIGALDVATSSANARLISFAGHHKTKSTRRGGVVATSSRKPSVSTLRVGLHDKSKGEAERDAMLRMIDGAVRTVYSACNFDLDAHPTTTDMVGNLEGLLEELTAKLMAIRTEHPQYVRAAEKKVDKERRDLQRQVRATEEAEIAEMRLVKSLARASKPVPKRTTKPVMFRSVLVKNASTTSAVMSDAEREAVEVERFFT